ncbi:MAG: SEL1-like repeat protein [Variibacter sp.]|nr:SEL1-like repeat protein [Variibacter sp.]
MESDESLNVQDLAPEIRQSAREAARRRGLSVRQWMQSAIMKSAADAGLDAAPDRTPPIPEAHGPAARAEGARAASASALQQQLDALSGQLDRLSHICAARPDADPAPQDGTREELTESLRAVEGELSALGRVSPSSPATQRLLEVLTGLNSRLDRLMAQKDRGGDSHHLLRGNAPPAPGASARGAAPDLSDGLPTGDWALDLDRAIAEIAARQRALDAEDDAGVRAQPAPPPPAEEAPAHEPHSGLADLQEKLTQLTEELRILRKPGGFADTIQALREELADIAHTLADAAPRRALEALEADVRALVERLDRTRQAAADPAALSGIERTLNEVRDALTSMAPAESLAAFRDDVRALDRKIEQIGAQGFANTEGLSQVQRAVRELREIASRAATGEALDALAEKVQALGEKIERYAAPPTLGEDLLASLDRRFQALAVDLNARAPAPQGPAADDLVALIEALSKKIEALEIGRESLPTLEAIVAHLARLADRMERSGTRLDQLDNIERSFTALLDRMDALRADTLKAAERVARDVASEYAGPAALPDARVEALQQNLDALRQSQLQSERRTQDTLEAVHDTLERLVDRLAAIEAGLRGEGCARAAAAAPRPDPVQGPAASPAAEARTRPHPGGKAASERRPIDPTLPADTPLEPGAVRARPAPSAAERVAASEAALGGSRPAPQPDAKANFIAAARRAALAAAHLSQAPEGAQEPAKSESSMLGTLAQKVTRHRSLLLAGAVLLVGAGAMPLVLDGAQLGRSGTTPPPATNEAPAPFAARDVRAPAQPVAAPGALDTGPSAGEPAPAGDAAAAAPAPGPKSDAPAMPTVSPLTIASIQLPAGDITGSLGNGADSKARAERDGAAPPLAILPPAATPAAALPPRLRAAAAAGDPKAAYEIATRYAEGRGVMVNLPEAARWFERAAAHNLAPAQYRLGSLYEKGQGVKKDLDKARRLYRAAADSGNGKAMHNLAVLYAEGVDGKPDFKLAAHWFRKAAERGIADSQYNLGILYARGLGVEQNLAESYKWFALAARQGDKEAEKKRDEVAARMDQSAIMAARLAVQTFTAEPQPEDAVTVKAPPGGWDAPAETAAPAKAKTGAAASRKAGS